MDNHLFSVTDILECVKGLNRPLLETNLTGNIN